MQAVLVGAGASGALHALALRAAGVRLAAVYDPDVERARAVVDACGGRVAPTLAAAAEADAAIAAICSPPSAHVAQAEALAGPGRTVFVEKPLATSRTELERLARLPGCVPVLQWRAGRALRALRRAVELGELGPHPVASCDLAWARSDDYFAARRGWGCGALLSIGIHAVDALAWSLGRPVERAAAIASRARFGADAEGETAAVALFGFAGGASASLRISLDGGADTTHLRVCGGGVTAELVGPEADPTGGTLRWFAASSSRRAHLEALERGTPGALGSPLLVPYLGAAIAALRDGERPGDGGGERLPSIADAFGAHAAALQVSA
jgi:predicted dehydrogenase